jgi:NADH dehydrogenase/NADH:ubiquinone oxidoreductase subunit G
MSHFRTSMRGETVRLTIDGAEITAPRGASVAGALLASGRFAFGGHPLSGKEKGPWCLIGICFGCLVEIDGVPDRQSYLVPASDGMTVRTRRQL